MQIPRTTISPFVVLIVWAILLACGAGSPPDGGPGVRLAVHPELRPLGLEQRIAEFEEKLGVRVELRYVEIAPDGPDAEADLFLTPQCGAGGPGRVEFRMARELIQPAGAPAGRVVLANPETPFGRLSQRALAGHRDPASRIEYRAPEELPPLLAAGAEGAVLWVPASWTGPSDTAPAPLDPWPELPLCIVGRALPGAGDPQAARRLAHFLEAALQYSSFGYIAHDPEQAGSGPAGHAAATAPRFSYWAIGSEL